MAKDPQYGVSVTPSEASLGLPFYPLYGVTPSDEYIPLKVDGAGVLATSATFSGSITIGEIGAPDESSFIYGTTVQQSIGGVYQDTSPTLSAGEQGAVRLTEYRAFHTNLRDSNGDELLGQSISATSLPVVIASDQSSIPVTLTPSALPASANFGQAVISTTGTAVNLGSGVLVNGVVISANTSNTASIVVGLVGVTNTTDGTGNGYVLAPGASIGIAVLNTNSLWINGTSGDVISYVGS